MKIKRICVIGGAGFVGKSIVSKLDADGYQITVLVRRRERAKALILLPNVTVQTCDFTNAQDLANGIKGSDAVINLVGILHEHKGNTFDFVHHQLPDRIAKACSELGIRRLLHMSALHADKNGPSKYLRSKAQGEEALHQYQDLDVTIFRPSVIFGRDDRFLNLFASLIKWLPVILLAKPDSKFQPIWVEDVANIVVNSLNEKTTYANSYDLAGPHVYSLRNLVEIVANTLGKQRWIIGLNDSLSYLQAWFMEWLPIDLISRDNIRSMEVDSIASMPMAEEIEFPLTPLEAVIPAYLINQTPRAAYDEYRTAAGRVINARR